MHSVTIDVDLAKTVFELAVANQNHRITERHRLSRSRFERFWGKREPCRVVMEACASAHFWARRLLGLGFDVILLPPHYVRPSVRRNKTDRADCEAHLEALRNPRIHRSASTARISRRSPPCIESAPSGARSRNCKGE